MLNRQGPEKIDWTDYTWNPTSGCLHRCKYCYMLRMEKRFPGIMQPAFHPERLKDLGKLKKPSKIFVGSSGDMWGEWVKKEWVEAVFKACAAHPEHSYQFLTKNPAGYRDMVPGFALQNAWFGTTDDGTARCKHNIHMLRECFKDAVFGPDLSVPLFVSFEPLLSQVAPVDLSCMDWVIIGADSTRGALKPPSEWADDLIEEARLAGAAVWVKDNYGYPERIKEFP